MAGKINVLVVDDSAVVRQILTTILAQAGDFEVVSASDPIFAMRKMESFKPDVIVLDLEMPRMDGRTFLKKIMQEFPTPVVICSSHVGSGSEHAVSAMGDGAVGLIAKPQIGVQEFLFESAVMLTDAVRGAAKAKLRRSVAPVIATEKFSADVVLPASRRASPAPRTSERIVAVGASTGGTEAIRVLLAGLTPSSPGLAIVQHMPEGFTRAFADRLNQDLPIDVKEAENGDKIRNGQALIAPGNQHMLVRRGATGFFVEVKQGELVSRHRPSVDVLFRSVAQIAGANAMGIILTGMGDDGARGLLEMKQSGAATIAQDEGSSVVFGMPKEAIELGAAGKIFPLIRMAAAINSWSKSGVAPR